MGLMAKFSFIQRLEFLFVQETSLGRGSDEK
jgi:hypothetical protein